MTNKHSQSFFGQKTALIVQSNLKSEPFAYLTCIEKKADGSWERFSQGEGKTIKISLEEIVMMLEVLRRKLPIWSTLHEYRGEKTQISLNWEEQKDQILWIKIGKYSKMMTISQIEIFKLLLEHLLKEKIKHGTSYFPENRVKNNNALEVTEEIIHMDTGNPNASKIMSQKISELSSNQQQQNNSYDSDFVKIGGKIKSESEKALLIVFDSGKEQWIPKSTVRSGYDKDKEKTQKFVIDTWVLRKNNIIN
ncbi:MAG: hypothetical protein ACTSRI_16785 [Promethearchaeota archaeon]